MNPTAAGRPRETDDEELLDEQAFWLNDTAFPRIIPVEPPIVNINKKRSPKNGELVLSSNNAGLPRYVLFQLKIFVPVGNDIKIVTPEK